MNLNKKFKFDGNRIVKIGKKELYAFVYKRTFDLTIYEEKLLDRYDLKKTKYIYIGSSIKYNLRHRSAEWKRRIDLNNKSVAKNIRIFINNLKLFLENETDLTDEEINEYLYYNAEVIARCESLKGARGIETYYTSRYHQLDSFRDILEHQVILLSAKDSSLIEIEKDSIRMLKAKEIA